jgi:hypothetical protein
MFLLVLAFFLALAIKVGVGLGLNLGLILKNCLIFFLDFSIYGEKGWMMKVKHIVSSTKGLFSVSFLSPLELPIIHACHLFPTAPFCCGKR